MKNTRNSLSLSSGVPNSGSLMISRTDLSKAFLLITFSSTSKRTSSFRCLICSRIAKNILNINLIKWNQAAYGYIIFIIETFLPVAIVVCMSSSLFCSNNWGRELTAEVSLAVVLEIKLIAASLSWSKPCVE